MGVLFRYPIAAAENLAAQAEILASEWAAPRHQALFVALVVRAVANDEASYALKLAAAVRLSGLSVRGTLLALASFEHRRLILLERMLSELLIIRFSIRHTQHGHYKLAIWENAEVQDV